MADFLCWWVFTIAGVAIGLGVGMWWEGRRCYRDGMQAFDEAFRLHDAAEAAQAEFWRELEAKLGTPDEAPR